MKPFLYEGTYVCYPMITIVEADRTIRNETLQNIVLFDLAETQMGLGQVNFRKTSSFCGKGNFVNGINHIQKTNLKMPAIRGEWLNVSGGIDVYDYSQWNDINKKIVRRSILPGAHICCAGEWCFGTSGDDMYVGVGIAIPEDEYNAILFMECVGKTIDITDDIIRSDIIESITQIGKNQGIEYKEIHVVTEEKTIKRDLGCSMVAIPYFLKGEKNGRIETK